MLPGEQEKQNKMEKANIMEKGTMQQKKGGEQEGEGDGEKERGGERDYQAMVQDDASCAKPGQSREGQAGSLPGLGRT